MTDTTSTKTMPVAVIGLGPMGQAMVHTLLHAGHPVTVWNRTAARADAVVAAGAFLAGSAAEAIAASDLVVFSLTDYQAMYDIVGTSTDALAGKVLVNLSSDTPDRSREAAAWASEHGAEFVTGGVMAPAPLVGTDDAYVYYSGEQRVFDAHAATLSVLGTPRYLGEDHGLAQLYYQAQVDIFVTALAAVLHAIALAASAGVPPGEFVPLALQTLSDTAAMSGGGDEIVTALTTGQHPGDLSTVLMMGAGVGHIVGASESAGIDVALPRAVQSLYDRAVAAGHGRDNWTSLYEVIKTR